MYTVYMDNILFPVAPGKIVAETENDNREVELIDGSSVVRVGGKGLRKISFELLLPMTKYPFAVYNEGFKDGIYYLDELNRIAAENAPVWLDIYRTTPKMEKAYLTNIRVVIQKITMTEDASNGSDMTVKVELIEYRSEETKIATEKMNTGYSERTDDLEIPDTYTVKKGDSLWMISKMFFGDGSKYTYLAEINSIKRPYTIHPGQVIRLRG